MFFDVGLGLGGDSHAGPKHGKHAGLGEALSAEDSTGHECLKQQQDGGEDQERHELVLEIHKADGGDTGRGQVVFELDQGGEVDKPGSRPGVGALSSLGGFDQG